MSTLLDNETVVLEGLDFEPTCDCNVKSGKCGKEATHQLICLECERTCGLSCIDHAIWVRTTDRRGKHTMCGVSGLLRELVKVVPL